MKKLKQCETEIFYIEAENTQWPLAIAIDFFDNTADASN